MSGKTNEGKWYVPKDLGIIKATEELDGQYFRYKGEDGKDRWMPAKVFKRKYQAMDEPFIDDEGIKLIVDSSVGERPDGVGEEEFQHFKGVLAEFGKNLLNTTLNLGLLRKEANDHAQGVV